MSAAAGSATVQVQGEQTQDNSVGIGVSEVEKTISSMGRAAGRMTVQKRVQGISMGTGVKQAKARVRCMGTEAERATAQKQGQGTSKAGNVNKEGEIDVASE